MLPPGSSTHCSRPASRPESPDCWPSSSSRRRGRSCRSSGSRPAWPSTRRTMPARADSPHSPPRRRADAERSIARILDATVDALASDPEASMAEVARRAGVVRATVYVHFPTREALIEAVTHRAIADVTAIIEAAEPDRGNAADALRRVVTSAWRTLGRYHALVAFNARLAS